MLEALERMSRSDDWEERVRAARLVAREEGVEADAIVLRLLWDAHNTAVCEAMVAALVETRGEAAILLILRALGDQPPGDDGEPADFMLMELMRAHASDLPVRGILDSVLVGSTDRLEVLGALRTLAWRAPFRVSEGALARIETLTTDSEPGMQSEAVLAYAEIVGRKTVALPNGDGSFRHVLVDLDDESATPGAPG